MHSDLQSRSSLDNWTIIARQERTDNVIIQVSTAGKRSENGLKTYLLLENLEHNYKPFDSVNLIRIVVVTSEK